MREGVNRKSLEAAIERSEFHFREGEQTSASRGLSLSLSMLQSWMYTDEEPFRYLKLDEIFLELRRWLKTDHYEELTRRIINSSRRALLMLTPEAGMNERLARELQDRLDIYRKTLNDDEYARLVREYRDYTEYQDRAESEGELSCIPYLSRSDMAGEPEPIFNRSATFAGIPAVIHEIPTDSLVYLRLMFDLSVIPAKYLPYLDLLTDVLGKTDTACMTLPQLQDGLAQVEAGRAQADSEFAAAREQISSGRAVLRDSLSQIEDGERELADGRAELEDAKAELEDGEAEYEK